MVHSTAHCGDILQAKKLLKARKKELDGGGSGASSADDAPSKEPMLPSHEEVPRAMLEAKISSGVCTAGASYAVWIGCSPLLLLQYLLVISLCSQALTLHLSTPISGSQLSSATKPNADRRCIVVQMTPITEDDYFAKNAEFSTWLRERRKVCIFDCCRHCESGYYANQLCAARLLFFSGLYRSMAQTS